MKRLNRFLDEEDTEDTAAENDAPAAAEGMSREEMLKHAMDRKKVAKANLNLKKMD